MVVFSDFSLQPLLPCTRSKQCFTTATIPSGSAILNISNCHVVFIVTWHLLAANSKLRRISCHGRNHSQASCEYSLTIFLCCQHHSEYSLLGSKFSTNLLFAASKCHVTTQQCGSSSAQNGRTGWDRCSGKTLLAPCTRKKRLQRKITKHYH